MPASHTYHLLLRSWLCGIALLACSAPAPPLVTSASLGDAGGRPILILTKWTDPRTDITLRELDSLGRAGRLYALAQEKDPIAELGYPLTHTPTVKDFLSAPSGSLLLASLEQASPVLKALRIEGHSFFSAPDTYPLWTKGARPTGWRDSFSVLILTGTTAITRATGSVIEKNGTNWLIEKILPLVRGADWLHISNEVSFLDTCSYRGGLRFCSRPAHAQAIIESLGVRIVELTGNHNLDFGEEPYRQTLQWYRKRGIHTFGGGLSVGEAYAPLMLTLRDSTRIAFLGYNQACPLNECVGERAVGAARYDSARAQRLIRYLRDTAGVQTIIVGVQFIESDSPEPLPSQKKIALDLLRYGADIVYGSQAHQPQRIAFYREKPVFFGLGNFLFDQIHREPVRQAYIIRLYLYRGKLVQFEPVYLYMTAERRPIPAPPEQKEAIRQLVFYAPYGE